MCVRVLTSDENKDEERAMVSLLNELDNVKDEELPDVFAERVGSLLDIIFPGETCRSLGSASVQ